uniref:Uncharacterized protein n=1 Tax=Leersia perrieri TaxID=77586 RepID=A0A0D9WP87_9ORYZ
MTEPLRAVSGFFARKNPSRLQKPIFAIGGRAARKIPDFSRPCQLGDLLPRLPISFLPTCNKDIWPSALLLELLYTIELLNIVNWVGGFFARKNPSCLKNQFLRSGAGPPEKIMNFSRPCQSGDSLPACKYRFYLPTIRIFGLVHYC